MSRKLIDPISSDSMSSFVINDDVMQARYEAFLKSSGLTKSFGPDPDSDTTDTSSDSGCEPEEFEEWVKSVKHWDLTSSESDSESDETLNKVADVTKSKPEVQIEFEDNSQDSPDEWIKDCDICKRTFKREILYQRHLKLHESGVSCSYPKCKNVYSSTADMRRHLKNHNDIKLPFVCTVCSLRFKTEKSLGFHTKWKHSKSSKSFESSASTDQGSSQLTTKASSVAKMKFQCQTSQKGSNESANLKRHFKQEQQDSNAAAKIQVKNVNKFHCLICRYDSLRIPKSNVHLQSHSVAEPKSLKDDECYSEIRIRKLEPSIEISDEEPIEISETDD